ncbi:MAG TPA: YciI family protein [Gemmatimonadaceae bacterium]|nr:YciI family protein [Gemmatimonadaceae bacterium]
MPRYLLFIEHGETRREDPIPEALLEAMGEFVNEHRKSGVLVDTAGLRPTAEATRIRSSRGKLSVTDGPFTETKEVVGGYALIDVGSRAEAIELATRFMDIHVRHWPQFECACEVREIESEPAPASASAAGSSGVDED